MLKERSRPEAIDRIKRTLALGEVAKREAIKVEPDEIKAKVSELMEELGDRDIDPDRLQAVVAEDLLKEKIVSWLLERSTIELVPEGTLAKPEDNAEADDLEANDAEEIEAANSTIDVTPVVETEASTTDVAVEATETDLPPTTVEVVAASDEASTSDDTTDAEKPKKARKAAKAKAESSDSE